MENIINNQGDTVKKSTKRTYQTGHAINVANLETALPFLEGYGSKYNPSRPILKLDALQTMRTHAVNSLNGVNVAHSLYTLAVSERELAFEDLDVYVTNSYLHLKTFETTQKVREDAMSFVNKLKGRRVTPKLSSEELEELSKNGEEIKYNSVAQLGYDSRVENFDRFVTLLASIEGYAPNEAAYSIEGLKEKLQFLRTKNEKVRQTRTNLSNARKLRDDVLYEPEIGLVDVMIAVRAYVRAVFGLNSHEFKQIKNLPFRNYRKW